MWWRDREGTEPAVIAQVVDLTEKRVLEVGCGKGRLTEFAAASAAEVLAFDPDPDAVEEARARVGGTNRVTFAVCGAQELALGERRFDVALCGWSL
jgi:2-polyprenyl-3-methyl-5-hydroxy-6-metoxy-1,4-benzoquinol methylase